MVGLPVQGLVDGRATCRWLGYLYRDQYVAGLPVQGSVGGWATCTGISRWPAKHGTSPNMGHHR